MYSGLSMDAFCLLKTVSWGSSVHSPIYFCPAVVNAFTHKRKTKNNHSLSESLTKLLVRESDHIEPRKHSLDAFSNVHSCTVLRCHLNADVGCLESTWSVLWQFFFFFTL